MAHMNCWPCKSRIHGLQGLPSSFKFPQSKSVAYGRFGRVSTDLFRQRSTLLQRRKKITMGSNLSKKK
uniref:Uncharacterized protein n=1 Tax=Arundo donax TaxID=35708 RepID=A0A0A9FK16_ARUDO